MRKIWWIGIIAPFVIFFLSGCEKATDVEHTQRAIEFESKGDLRSAIIEYKSALKLNDDPKTRFLLGSLHARIGDADSAEKELGIAIRKGYRVGDAKVMLARVFAFSHLYQKLLDEVSIEGVTDDANKGKLLAYRGLAYLGLGNQEESSGAISEAEAIGGDLPEVRYVRAYQELSSGNVDNARSIIQTVAADKPDYKEARLLWADIEFSQSNAEQAEKIYRELVSEEPQNLLTAYGLRANLGLIQALIAENNIPSAKERITYLEKMAPNNPMVLYFDGVVAHQEKNLALSEDQLLKVLNIVPGHKPSMLLLGAIKYEQGEYRQAEEYLSKYVKADPTHLEARKLLAATRMKLRQPESAMDALEPMLDILGDDVNTLLMAGSAAVRSGELNLGTSYLKKAVSMAPDNVGARTELALAYMAESDYAKAIHELEKASEQSDDMAKKANLLLVLTHLRNGDEEGALKEAENYLAKYPKEAASYNLLGVIYQKTGDEKAAIKSFEKALEFNPKYTPAAVNIARIAQKDGKLKEAKERFESILAYEENNVSVMMALAQISQKLGKEEEAIKWLTEAVRRSSDAYIPRLMLARYYLAKKDILNAQKYISEAKNVAPEEPRVWLTQGMLDMVQGDLDKALSTYNRVLDIDPQSVIALYQSGYIHSRKGEYEAARELLNKALKVAPDHALSIVLLAHLHIREGQLSKSRELIKHLSEIRPDSYELYVLQGDLAYAEKNFDKAISFYKKAYDVRQGESLVLRMAKAYKKSGEENKSFKVLLEGLGDEPNSYRLGLAVAGEQVKRGEKEKAVKTYESILANYRDDPVVLNNLAWLYFELNNDSALSYAERAYKAEPKDPYILDTYGWILIQEGEVNKGIRLLKQASDINSDIAELQYHLAVALIKAGKPTEAKPILEELLRSPEGLSIGVDEIRKIINDL